MLKVGQTVTPSEAAWENYLLRHRANSLMVIPQKPIKCTIKAIGQSKTGTDIINLSEFPDYWWLPEELDVNFTDIKSVFEANKHKILKDFEDTLVECFHDEYDHNYSLEDVIESSLESNYTGNIITSICDYSTGQEEEKLTNRFTELLTKAVKKEGYKTVKGRLQVTICFNTSFVSKNFNEIKETIVERIKEMRDDLGSEFDSADFLAVMIGEDGSELGSATIERKE